MKAPSWTLPDALPQIADETDLHLRSALSGDATRFAEFRAIYEERFPPEQRLPWPEIERGMREGRFFFAGVWLDGAAAAFALLTVLPASRACHVGFLAVDRRHEGEGAATAVARLRTVVMGTRAPNGLLLEIEDPATAPTPAQARHRERLRRMYERWDARMVCPSGYGMPHPAGEEVIPLQLMWMPGSAAPDHMRGEILVTAVEEMWRDSYLVPGPDPRLDAVREAARSAGPSLDVTLA